MKVKNFLLGSQLFLVELKGEFFEHTINIVINYFYQDIRVIGNLSENFVYFLKNLEIEKLCWIGLVHYFSSFLQ